MKLDYCSPLIKGKTSSHALTKVALENFRRIESRIRMSIVFKIGVSYQEHMILEEVARENFRRESMENWNVYHGGIWDFVSGAHDTRRCGTRNI